MPPDYFKKRRFGDSSSSSRHTPLQMVLCIDAMNDQDIFSFSYGAGDNLLAGGCKEKFFLWDWRKSKQIACLEDSHMDDVTQVHFAPNNRNKLLSAYVDGLICVFRRNANHS